MTPNQQLIADANALNREVHQLWVSGSWAGILALASRIKEVRTRIDAAGSRTADIATSWILTPEAYVKAAPEMITRSGSGSQV